MGVLLSSSLGSNILENLPLRGSHLLVHALSQTWETESLPAYYLWGEQVALCFRTTPPPKNPNLFLYSHVSLAVGSSQGTKRCAPRSMLLIP